MSQQSSGTDRSGTVRVSGHLRCASPQDADLLRQHLPEHVRLSRAEPGCLAFDVSPTQDSLVWRVEETFIDQAAFEFHKARTRASAWWQATAGIARDIAITGIDPR
ncbi:putative quinol monooxygenase [Pararhodobacter sp. SW119]|uniref:putative quinol monooxygenase n=1 Tax=Pararhodobacter sp. SW119 TaxID=2780075 RepID=UPI001ADF7AC2|nr:putative quinol monooxygenase [Pararhodobacter sp. SW119]